ncbi:MAG TPA: potassium-transporting ATPase subunit KdpB [Thermomicrobiales bacterium]|nr:potassium-transporting ATPase subunit KdpB [Thermomicrobiales bacterium]
MVGPGATTGATGEPSGARAPAPDKRERRLGYTRRRPLFEPAIVRPALVASLAKLDPRWLVRNPVMFVVEVVSVVETVIFARDAVLGRGGLLFTGQIAAWLWFTVLFANFAEAMAEGRGKAQADTLRRTRQETVAKRLVGAGRVETVPGAALRRGDLVLVEAGDLIPSDGEVVAGVAYVNEAAITGESAPVLKEPGTDIRSSVTGGTTIVSDRLTIRITADPGQTFLDRMIALVEGAARQRTPNEIALTILLAGLTIVFLLATATLLPFSRYAGAPVTATVLIALLVCLIPTTIGALLSAIGIAGMDRVVQRNVLAMSGRAVEAAGDIDTMLLDKTGTITYGNRLAAAVVPVGGHSEAEVLAAALRASVADDTPEGKSIVALAGRLGYHADGVPDGAEFIPFSAETRMSGIQVDGRRTMKGAVDAVSRLTDRVPADLQPAADRIAGEGGTPLAVVDGGAVLGVIYLKDTVKPGLRPRFDELRTMGIRTVMVTGDNPLTARTIAREAGVDDFLAQVTPEQKLAYVRAEQARGHLLAMTGDGTNDAPALAQADVGLAMNSGTSAAKEAGNMVDLDSDPTKLIEVIEVGKQLLITRGALTTFSIANDVAKYFAIIPAAFAVTYPELNALNVMRLATPQSAILSAVVFNALIIPLLIPLALRGVRYRPVGASALLRRNLLLYGVGGIIAPFLGIKLLDLILHLLHLA